MKLLRNTLFIVAIILLTAASNDNKYLAKIAVVDVESILEKSLAIANIKKSMDGLSESIEKEISMKDKEFKIQENELLKNKAILNEEDFEKLVTEFNKNVSDVQKDIQKRRLTIERSRSAAIEKVHETTMTIINELAKKHGFNLVLPSNQVLFVSNDLNITLEVISNLNDRLTEVAVDSID